MYSYELLNIELEQEEIIKLAIDNFISFNDAETIYYNKLEPIKQKLDIIRSILIDEGEEIKNYLIDIEGTESCNNWDLLIKDITNLMSSFYWSPPIHDEDMQNKFNIIIDKYEQLQSEYVNINNHRII